ncbi:hypothetical protein TNCV_1936491 [Trichonephila clavipes]|nr:hypothetical protein TNCV_1936491 [Trichonephila clavipes]
MTTPPNCDYLVSIEWMRYQSQCVPYRIFFASPFDNKQVEIHPTLESLHSFTYQDIVKNLKYYPSFLEDNDGRASGSGRVATFSKVSFGKRQPWMDIGDWSHRFPHLHVFGPHHSRSDALYWKKTPGRCNGPRNDETSLNHLCRLFSNKLFVVCSLINYL